MHIRKAGLPDLELVAPLFDGYRQFYSQPSDLPRAKGFLRERLERGDSVILLAVENDRGLGFTQLYPLLSSISCRPLWLNRVSITLKQLPRSAVHRTASAARRRRAAFAIS